VRFGLLGVSVALTWFFVLSTAVSVLAAALAALATRRWAGRHGTRPAGWLALRLMPSVAAGAFLVIAFGPAYLRFEPRDGTEPLKAPLALAALAGGLLIALTARRLLRASRQLAALERDWRARATAAPASTRSMPVFIVDGPGPVATLVGVFRPRLYLSRAVADALAPEEMAAVLAHEVAHRRRRDNLARWIMLATPDLYAATRYGLRTAEQWAAAAERLADEEAVAGNPRTAVALASALVSVARLMPPAPRFPLPTSGLDDGGILAERVRRLLGEPVHPRRHVYAWVSAVTLAVLAAGVTIASGSLPLHREVHDVTEWLVRFSW
jgi:Zn-dependent protease with chaperone function